MDEEIFSFMKWCNPENWTDDKDYGIVEIKEFASHFHILLLSTIYGKMKFRLEWINFCCHVSLNPLGKEACVLWKNILSYKGNIWLLAELIYCLSRSNVAIKRGLSILTKMLSDWRLKTSDGLMNFCTALEINNKNWSEKEKSEILWWALEIYLSQSRQKWEIDEPSSSHIVEVQSSDSIESHSHSSDYDSYNFPGKDNSCNEQFEEKNHCKIIFHVKFSIKTYLISKNLS